VHWEVFVVVASSLFISAVGIPMALDKIPPNALYGFRTPRTLSDEKLWYAANRDAGRALTLAGIVGALGSVVAGAAIADGNTAMFTSMGAMMVPLTVAVLWSFYRASAEAAELDDPGQSAHLLGNRKEEPVASAAPWDEASDTRKRAAARQHDGEDS